MKLMKNCKTGIVFVIMTMLIGSSFVGSMVFVSADEGEDPPYSLVFEPVYEDFSENGFPPYVPPETPEGNETIQLPLSMTESALSVKTNDVYTSQAAEYIKYDTPLGISPLTGDSTLSPPWDDSDSGIEIFTYGFPPHDEWATDNRYTGFSDLGCHGTCCIAQEVRTWVWAWFEGHYDCSNAGEYYVQFEINYEGIVAAANIPVGLGAGILKIESNAIFEIAGQEYGTHLIFFEDSFPLVGDYPVPGPYDEQGPFIIGYEDPIHLEPGEHEFYVQFNVFIHCLAVGFAVAGGGMQTDNWLLSANIQPTEPFSIDLVSSEYFLIEGILYYGVWTDPLVFEKGDDVKLKAAVFNVGADDANGFHIKVGLDGIYEAKTPNPVSLPASQHGIWETPYIEWPYDSDVHYVWCYADCDSDINEMVEDNNIGVHPTSAWGDPELDIEEATLVKVDDSWPPAWDTIDWQNADVFENGDRVSPLALINNDGEGPTGEDPDYEFHIKLYMDDVIFAEGDAPLGPGGSAVAYVEEIDVGPGFDWPDSNCHTFRWEVDDSVHGLHDELQETYCPEVTPPYLVWDPASHNFGTITVGEQSSNYGFTLTNTGGTSTSGTVSVTDDFHIDGSASYDLGSDGGSKTFQVYFKPLSEGSHSGTLQASSANQPTASLSGVGQLTPPYLVWDPASHNFGTITVGEQSSNYGFTLTNTGGTSTSGTVSVTDDFHIDGSASYDLGSDGGSKTFQVYFKPLSEGSHSGTLQASSANQPTASLSGTGEDPNPEIELTPPEGYNFGDVVVDTCSPEFEFTLTNVGTGTATGSVSLTGSNPVDFYITEGGGSFSLGANGQKSIKVKFCPTDLVPRYATLYADGSNCNDDSSSLSGTGVEPNPILSYSPQSIDFGTHLQGWTDSSSFEVWNDGTGTLIYDVIEAIDWITLNGDTHSDSTGSDDKKTVIVNVVNTGTMNGSYEENIEISSNGGSGNVTVSITIEEPTPILRISDNYIDFGKRLQGWTGDDTFIIWNSGTGTLEYDFSETSSWFTLSQYSGDSTGPSDQDTITIYVDNTGTLEAGEHLETIEVTSNGGDLNITVRIFIDVPAPELFVHPTQIYYTVRRDNSKTQPILVKNTGDADLYWQIPPESYDWGDITADPGSGSLVPGDEINVDVIVAVGRWADLGECDGEFTVHADGCTDIKVRVNLSVLTKWEDTCFLAGTQITMANGSYKNIENITVGDTIKSYNVTTSEIENATVTKVYDHIPDEMPDYYLVINNKINVTPNHIVFINDTLMRVKYVKVGDVIVGINGENTTIDSIEQVFENLTTYNFEFSPTSNLYIADDLGAYALKIKINQPMKPSGEYISVNKGVNYTYSTSTTDIAGGQIFYRFDWGDGTNSSWLGPFNSGETVNASHMWNETGNYEIKVDAMDSYGEISKRSDSLAIATPLEASLATVPSELSTANEIIYFNDNSFPGYYEIVNWTWNFGDGNFSYEQDASHEYAVNGVYNVTLTVTDNQSNNDVYYQIIIIDSLFGYTKSGASSEIVEDRITGSVFTVDEYGVADNITAFINQIYMSPGPYKCMIYRLNDSKLIGTTTEDWESLPQENPIMSSWWAVFNFTEPKPVLEKDTQYVLTCWGENEYNRIYYDVVSQSDGRYDTETYGTPSDPANFSNENRVYSIYCSYTPTAPEKPTLWGPLTIKEDIEYTYNASTIDPDENASLYYQFDWGDNSELSDWIGPFASGATCNNATHTWTEQGYYDIKVRAKDESGDTSCWSDPLPIVAPFDDDPEPQVGISPSIHNIEDFQLEVISIGELNIRDDDVIESVTDVIDDAQYYYGAKIKNIGSTDIEGYLRTIVRYFDQISEQWITLNDPVNDTTPRTINSGRHLALGPIFKGRVHTRALTNGNGNYRVYAVFGDSDGNVLKCADDTYLVAKCEFTVTGL